MEVMELKGSSLRAAPRAPVPLWHELPAELLLRILTVDGIGGAELSRTGATCVSWREVETKQRGQLWAAACARYGMRQVGTRRRGWQSWRELFISQCCIECRVPAAHVFNLGAATTPPGVLRWAGTRVPVCEQCCACFHDFPRTCNRWQRHGLQVRRARVRYSYHPQCLPGVLFTGGGGGGAPCKGQK